MPIKRKLMDSLKKRYGKNKGEDVYYGLEQKGRQERRLKKKFN
jgi:hypothetical protein